MPVGKAKAAAKETAGEEFRLIVPCFTSVDESHISDQLERNHFLWLDLTSPTTEDLVRLRDVFGFHPLAQLTVIATIFLPLAFITGFFGQNFAIMVKLISHPWAFWVLGVGSMVATCVGLLMFFRRKGWV
jgi:Mg2+ and Co2+ transporter CorA